MYESENHLADYESALAQAKAERQALIDSDRPNWQNSLAELLEWQQRHGVTAEELAEAENRALRIAIQLQDAGAWKLLNAGCHFHEMMAYFIFANNPRDIHFGEWANIHFDVAMRITSISTGIMVGTRSNEALKAFFSND
jgi:hypothetical protein